MKLAALGSASVWLPGLAACGGATDDPAVGPDPEGNTGNSGVAPLAPRADALIAGTAVRAFAPDGRSAEVGVQRNFVDVLGLDGQRVTRIGDAARAPGRALGDVNGPVAAVWDGDSRQTRLLVLELGNERLQAFDATGRSLGTLASTERGLDVALGDDAIYVAESVAHRVSVLSKDGRSKRSIGSFGTDGAGLNGPSSVALAPDGSVHVVDAGSTSVKVFSASGGFSGSYGASGKGQLVGPRAIRFDTEGRAWVADAFAGSVVVYDAQGGYLTRITARTADGKPGVPHALCPLESGTMYVAVTAAG